MNKKKKIRERRLEQKRLRKLAKQRRASEPEKSVHFLDRTKEERVADLNVKSETITEQKVEKKPIKLETNIMSEKAIKKLLLILPADKKLNRIIRRGVVVAILTLIAFIGQETLVNYGQYIPIIWVPVVSGILAALDKTLREFKEK